MGVLPFGPEDGLDADDMDADDMDDDEDEDEDVLI